MIEIVNLERLKEKLSLDFDPILKEIDTLLKSELGGRDISSVSHSEMVYILSKLHSNILGLLERYTDLLKVDWSELYEHRSEMLYMKASAIVAGSVTVSNPATVEAVLTAVFDKPNHIHGSLGISIDNMVGGFTKSESDRIVNAIRLAHLDGKTTQDVLRQIRGTKAKGYSDGILSTTKRQAETLARTGTAIVDTQSTRRFIESNMDIVLGIKVVASLDSRTSTICRSLDGQFMPIDKATYPPYHYNCRSAFEIVYDGYQSPAKRASKSGVVDNVTYYEWLKQQPASYQDEVLGATRAKIFRDSGLSVERFRELQLDRNFRPMTIEEMRKLEPQAIAKALGD